jgi:hypothetical protein
VAGAAFSGAAFSGAAFSGDFPPAEDDAGSLRGADRCRVDCPATFRLLGERVGLASAGSAPSPVRR